LGLAIKHAAEQRVAGKVAVAARVALCQARRRRRWRRGRRGRRRHPV
jgi:hypothetical protein